MEPVEKSFGKSGYRLKRNSEGYRLIQQWSPTCSVTLLLSEDEYRQYKEDLLKAFGDD